MSGRADRSLARADARSGATESATQDRLGPDARIGLEARDDLRRDRAPEDPLDVVQELRLVDADQRDGPAVDAGTTGPADPVDVVLGDHRQLEVDDVRQRVDVEAARGDLGGDEDRVLVRLEVGEGADPLRLALVAVDRGRRDAVVLELRRRAGSRRASCG